MSDRWQLVIFLSFLSEMDDRKWKISKIPSEVRQMTFNSIATCLAKNKRKA